MLCCCFGGRRIYTPNFVLPDGPIVHIFSSGRYSFTDGHMKDGRQLGGNSVWDPRDTPEGFVISES